jgi:hypothetical protein
MGSVKGRACCGAVFSRLAGTQARNQARPVDGSRAVTYRGMTPIREGFE